ncbi:hypothetical protein VE04_03896 [Pseudogymnoascus sp. 24MN13]|nr:hypothetical protein VE04_03896 [Pseudogymnoascus sp. 24MN13]
MGNTHISGRDGGRDGGATVDTAVDAVANMMADATADATASVKADATVRPESNRTKAAKPTARPTSPTITLPGDPTIPFLANQQMRNGERYGMFEGGLGNGYSYAGQNEFIPGNGGRENVRSYVGQNEPIAGAQQQGNNGLAPGGQLAGLDDLDRYSPLGTWAGDVSRGYNAWTDRFLDSGPNGGPPARNA